MEGPLIQRPRGIAGAWWKEKESNAMLSGEWANDI
jgi:hypothetical protein